MHIQVDEIGLGFHISLFVYIIHFLWRCVFAIAQLCFDLIEQDIQAPNEINTQECCNANSLCLRIIKFSQRVDSTFLFEEEWFCNCFVTWVVYPIFMAFIHHLNSMHNRNSQLSAYYLKQTIRVIFHMIHNSSSSPLISEDWLISHEIKIWNMEVTIHMYIRRFT